MAGKRRRQTVVRGEVASLSDEFEMLWDVQIAASRE